MIDSMTRKPLHVSTEGTMGPYIRATVHQLEELCELLDNHGIRYCVEEHVISLDGGPEIAVVDLGRGTDADAVQTILDSAR